MTTISDCRHLYLSEKEMDLLKTLLGPGTDFDDDGYPNDKASEETQMLTRLYSRLVKQRRGDASAIWVSTYSIQNMYGGPEEGGWWYDHHSLATSKGFTEAEEAIDCYNQTIRDIMKAYDLTEHSIAAADLTLLKTRIESMEDGNLVVIQDCLQTDKYEWLEVVIELQLGCMQTTERPIYC